MTQTTKGKKRWRKIEKQNRVEAAKLGWDSETLSKLNARGRLKKTHRKHKERAAKLLDHVRIGYTK